MGITAADVMLAIVDRNSKVWSLLESPDGRSCFLTSLRSPLRQVLLAKKEYAVYFRQ
jgi:hypothetical protein